MMCSMLTEYHASLN